MKCAKSVKVKYSASSSGSGGTGVLPACRAASVATVCGAADPTWWTCSSAFGRPAMNSVVLGIAAMTDSDTTVSGSLRRPPPRPAPWPAYPPRWLLPHPSTATSSGGKRASEALPPTVAPLPRGDRDARASPLGPWCGRFTARFHDHSRGQAEFSGSGGAGGPGARGGRPGRVRPRPRPVPRAGPARPVRTQAPDGSTPSYSSRPRNPAAIARANPAGSTALAIAVPATTRRTAGSSSAVHSARQCRAVAARVGSCWAPASSCAISATLPASRSVSCSVRPTRSRSRNDSAVGEPRPVGLDGRLRRRAAGLVDEPGDTVEVVEDQRLVDARTLGDAASRRARRCRRAATPRPLRRAARRGSLRVVASHLTRRTVGRPTARSSRIAELDRSLRSAPRQRRRGRPNSATAKTTVGGYVSPNNAPAAPPTANPISAPRVIARLDPPGRGAAGRSAAVSIAAEDPRRPARRERRRATRSRAESGPGSTWTSALDAPIARSRCAPNPMPTPAIAPNRRAELMPVESTAP